MGIFYSLLVCSHKTWEHSPFLFSTFLHLTCPGCPSSSQVTRADLAIGRGQVASVSKDVESKLPQPSISRPQISPCCLKPSWHGKVSESSGAGDPFPCVPFLSAAFYVRHGHTVLKMTERKNLREDIWKQECETLSTVSQRWCGLLVPSSQPLALAPSSQSLQDWFWTRNWSPLGAVTA